MSTLTTQLRNKLERTVIKARDAAESGAKEALESLAVHHHEPYGHMNPDARKLRRHLRARARQLGDRQDKSGRLDTRHIVHECAYEYWRRMLFARFLAENDLLIDPDLGVAITLAECGDLARDACVDKWVCASRCAQEMLPQIFRPDDPLLQVPFAANHRIELESLLDGLTPDTFTASDTIGWVYQFWQSTKKDEVNAPGNKIGADELPAVTQLFTEDYMVDFLLDNTLGAWWAGKQLSVVGDQLSVAKSEEECRRLVALPGCEWKYLRFANVEAASSRFSYFNPNEPIENLTGNLPHWRQDVATYFVTFRCADSLPQDKLARWRDEMAAWLKAHPEPHDEATRKEFYETFPQRIQNWLDAGYGRCLLKKDDHRHVVENGLKHFDGDRYDLDEFVVAANHVHVIVTPKPGEPLSSILHSWKSFTANKINAAEDLVGTFWQKESFDHIVRNEKSLHKFREYIREHKAASRGDEDEEGKRLEAASTLNIACCGLKIGGTKEEWCALAPGNNFIMNQVYDLFRNASTLGSLIDPASQVKTEVGGPDVGSLKDAILQGLETFRTDQDFERQELGGTGGGVLDAYALLTGRFHVVATNVPYLARGKQSTSMKEFIDTNFPASGARRTENLLCLMGSPEFFIK